MGYQPIEDYELDEDGRYTGGILQVFMPDGRLPNTRACLASSPANYNGRNTLAEFLEEINLYWFMW